MRGKPATVFCVLSAFRITPAGAGKTPCNIGERQHRKDHPRRCGENLLKPAKLSAALGSPPQVRGKRYRCRDRTRRRWITPAGAGKTNERWLCVAIAQDHPRRCGENPFIFVKRFLHPGSPPQVRGKPAFSSFAPSRRRITPAGAGKTYWLPLHQQR